jgi:hypothetical protein
LNGGDDSHASSLATLGGDICIWRKKKDTATRNIEVWKLINGYKKVNFAK